MIPAKRHNTTQSIASGKFIMLCISCQLFNTLEPLRPYRNATIRCDNDRQLKEVEKYAKSIGIQLE